MPSDLPSPPESTAPSSIASLSISELEHLLQSAPESIVLIDVRYPNEYAFRHLPGSILVPFTELKRGEGITKIRSLLQARKLDHPNQECRLVIYCTGGVYSAKAVSLLEKSGIPAMHLQEGIQSWQQELPPFSQSEPSATASKNHLINNMQLFHSTPPRSKQRPLLYAGLCSAVLGIGFLGWAGYRVIHQPDLLKPLIQAGVPLHALSGLPKIGDAILAAEIPQVTVQQLQQLIDSKANILLVDVRTVDEFNKEKIPGAVSVPLTDIEQGAGVSKIQSMLHGQKLIAYCTSGYRSGKALLRLRKAGIDGTQVKGGITAWHAEIAPSAVH